MQVTIGNYTFVDSFYVVNVVDTKLVLGVKWLYYIGENLVNYQIPKMKFQDSTGVLRVVRGQHTYPKWVVNCNSMRSILRHGDIEWAAECYITSPKPKISVVKQPKEIETLLHKYEKVFRDLPHGRPPDRGLSITLFWRRVLHPFIYHLIEIPRSSYMILIGPFKNSYSWDSLDQALALMLL